MRLLYKAVATLIRSPSFSLLHRVFTTFVTHDANATNAFVTVLARFFTDSKASWETMRRFVFLLVQREGLYFSSYNALTHRKSHLPFVCYQ